MISRCSTFYEVSVLYKLPVIFTALCVLRNLCLFPGCRWILLCFLLEDFSSCFLFFLISCWFPIWSCIIVISVYSFNVLKWIQTGLKTQCTVCLMNFEEGIFCSCCVWWPLDFRMMTDSISYIFFVLAECFFSFFCGRCLVSLLKLLRDRS